MPQLRSINGPQQGILFPVTAAEFRIGREPGFDLVLNESSGASRHHASIRQLDGQWLLQDHQSTNGTRVNGQRVETRILKPGDDLEIGDFHFVFESGAASPAQGAAVTPPAHAAEEDAMQHRVRAMRDKMEAISQELSKVIIGQKDIVRQLLMAIISNGHVLMVGLPGLAKTLMISTLSRILDLNFCRIQFTPDLMPSDITGTDVLEVEEKSGQKVFRFIKGPVFTNILLADEINRTPPKTQAALLEAMQEHKVTAAGQTYPLIPPFFVLATQNPLEQEGTYPLPEAQLDRFMFSIFIDYPDEADEERIAKVTTMRRSVPLNKVMTGHDILEVQAVLNELPISDHVVKYATRLARATRPGNKWAPEFVGRWLHCGAGPRATQYLVIAAKARAVLDGRLLVNCTDVRESARPVLRHRLFTNFSADAEGITTDKIVRCC